MDWCRIKSPRAKNKAPIPSHPLLSPRLGPCPLFRKLLSCDQHLQWPSLKFIVSCYPWIFELKIQSKILSVCVFTTVYFHHSCIFQALKAGNYNLSHLNLILIIPEHLSVFNFNSMVHIPLGQSVIIVLFHKGNLTISKSL